MYFTYITTLNICIPNEVERRGENEREVEIATHVTYPYYVLTLIHSDERQRRTHTGIDGQKERHSTAEHNEPTSTQIMLTPIEMKDARCSNTQ